eukprot:scaffold62577_cov21-Tisochrysis_lutea.AAC.1
MRVSECTKEAMKCQHVEMSTSRSIQQLDSIFAWDLAYSVKQLQEIWEESLLELTCKQPATSGAWGNLPRRPHSCMQVA